ncbi:MAG: PIG-L family deacetylase [Bacteroidales bacterium]
MKNILIVAPHPDDEVLGCGGVIRKHVKSGDTVFILVITRGNPKFYSDIKIENVRSEARSAHQFLGVIETRFLDFYAPNLDTTSQAELSQSIATYIKEKQINTLYLPHRGDIHHDHRAVFNAGLVAARPVNENTVTRIYAYETLSETEWAAPFGDDAFIPTHFVNVETEFIDKLEAMSFFRTQVRQFPSTRSLETIEALATFRGATVGFHRAEAFMVIRTIEE